MQAVFLTRKFPPSKGGMQTFSYQLTQHFSQQKRVISVGQSQWHILWAAPVLMLAALTASRNATVLHWGDGLLAPAAALVYRLTHCPTVVTVHGLEITYNGCGGLLRTMVLWGLRRVQHVVAVSDNTAELLKSAGIPHDRITVIPHGIVATKPLNRVASRAAVWAQYVTGDSTSPFIVSVGRLVPRKGVAWFVEHVLAQLRDLPWIYLVASDGPEQQHIQSVVNRLGLHNRVRLIGEVPTAMLTHLYSSADIFVMPNVIVPGDVEGFGFVAVEAASHGALVISSNTQGIPSAIHDGRNGMLLAVGDARAYADAIRYWLTHPDERVQFGAAAREYTLQHFRWDDIAQRYAVLFEKLQQRNGKKL